MLVLWRIVLLFWKFNRAVWYACCGIFHCPLASHSRLASWIIHSQHSLLGLLRKRKGTHSADNITSANNVPLASHSRFASWIIHSQYSLLWFLRKRKGTHSADNITSANNVPLASHSRLGRKAQLPARHSLLWLLRFVKTSHCDVFTRSPTPSAKVVRQFKIYSQG